MKIAFVVCGNGYGHLKRVCSVINEIYKIDKNVSVIVAGATHHQSMLKAIGISNQLARFPFVFFNAELEQNLNISLPSDYSFEQYQASFTRTLEALGEFGPDKIVSDNLVGLLHFYPDALLMGSFLWRDILMDSHHGEEEITRICEFEQNLLDKHQPLMLGVEDMAMPEARRKTNFIGLPWFCTPHTGKEESSRGKTEILVTGGGTGKASGNLLMFAQELATESNFKVMLDRSLYQQANGDFELFDFDPEAFASLDWIVGRPGIGILTDAVQYSIPVCALDEGDKEMRHNARRVEELGIGIRIGVGENKKLLQSLQAPAENLKENIRSLQTGGATQAAIFILNN